MGFGALGVLGSEGLGFMVLGFRIYRGFEFEGAGTTNLPILFGASRPGSLGAIGLLGLRD